MIPEYFSSRSFPGFGGSQAISALRPITITIRYYEIRPY